jgi:hypothetical protein
MLASVGSRTGALVVPGVLLAVAPPTARAQPAVSDPALCLPGIEESVRRNPADWDQRLQGPARAFVAFQRAIGTHGLVFGFSESVHIGADPHPSVVVHVTYWDGTDLFAAGLPRTYEGKPVVVMSFPDIPRAAPGDPPGKGPTPGPAVPWRPGCPDPGRAVPLPGGPVTLPRAGGPPTGVALLGALLGGAGALLRGRRRP